MNAILARDLSKTYWYYEKAAGLGGSLRALIRGKKVFVDAVRGVDLDIHVGEVVGFIGPNGAGKTTTLKMLSGILHPSSGQVEVIGFVPFKREKAFLQKISLVSGQRNRLFWDLPVEEYFQFCKAVYEIPDDVFRRSRRDLIELAEIEDILYVPQRKLSFGQRKRCELVATLLHEPRIIFLDEPTNGLDLINARKIRKFIREKGQQGGQTIMLTSHNMSDIEQACDRVIIINEGRIVFAGNFRDLNRINGFKKQIRVTFKGPWTREKVAQLGGMEEVNSQEALLKVATERAASVAAHLFANFPVQDIDIKDPPLEQVIESIYMGDKG